MAEPNNGTIPSFESLLLNNKQVNTHPQLAEKMTDYTEAVANGYEPPEDVLAAILDLDPADEAAEEALETLEQQLRESGLIKFDIDVVVANFGQSIGGGPWEPEQNEILLNDGSGTLTSAAQPPGDSFSISAALGDLDGDGDLDMFVSNDFLNAQGQGDGGPNQVLLNDGTGTFAQAETQPVGDAPTYKTVLGDFDLDGDLDAFVVNARESYTIGTDNQVLLNNGVDGDGDWLGFSEADSAGGTNSSLSAALGDLDGDEDLDVFVANTDGKANEVLLNGGTDGSGNWLGFALAPSETQPTTEYNSYDVALGDLDADGDLDAFVVDLNQPHEVLLNQTDGGPAFGGFASSTLGGFNMTSTAVSLGDLDGDEDLDVFVVNTNGKFNQVLLNNGADEGTWLGFSEAAQELVPGAQDSFDVTLSDLDNDGDLDAYVANFNAGQSNQLLLNEGVDENGNWLGFSEAEGQWDSETGRGVAVGDVDGDGDFPAVDENGLPNINPDGLLPSMYADDDMIA